MGGIFRIWLWRIIHIWLWRIFTRFQAGKQTAQAYRLTAGAFDQGRGQEECGCARLKHKERRFAGAGVYLAGHVV